MNNARIMKPGVEKFRETENPFDRVIADYQVRAIIPPGRIQGAGEVVIQIPLEVDGKWYVKELTFRADAAMKFARTIGDAVQAAREGLH